MFVFGFKGLLPWWYSIKGHLFSFYVAILMSICAKICFFLFPKTSCHQGSTAHPCVAPQCIKSKCFRSTRTKASLTTRSAFRIGCLQLCRYPKVTFQLLGSKHRCSKQDFQGTIWKSCSTKHIADMQQESTLKGRCSAWGFFLLKTEFFLPTVTSACSFQCIMVESLSYKIKASEWPLLWFDAV